MEYQNLTTNILHIRRNQWVSTIIFEGGVDIRFIQQLLGT